MVSVRIANAIAAHTRNDTLAIPDFLHVKRSCSSAKSRAARTILKTAQASAYEILLRMRALCIASHPAGRQSHALRLQSLRPDSLSESEVGDRFHPGMAAGGKDTRVALQACNRAALRLLDATGRLHGKQ